MACSWCQDEEFARALMVALCNDENDMWKQDANPCLCICMNCVKEYHKLKDEYLEEHPQHEKTLYQMEVERIKNHLLRVHSALCKSDSDRKGQTTLNEKFFNVTLLEVLQYPYLLFNNDVMDSFLKCFLLLNDDQKFWKINEKCPGVYLLLFNPCFKVRLWALTTTQNLGWITMEDYPRVNAVISCMLKISLYGLLDNDLEVEHWPVPKNTINEETKPLTHIYYPLNKKDLWIGYCSIFKSLENNVLRMLLNSRGNSQLLDIIKNMLLEKDEESCCCFWSLVFTLHLTMEKLGSTFWLLLNFDDSPEVLLRLIVKHNEFKKCLSLLQLESTESANSIEALRDKDPDEYVFNQIVFDCYHGMNELPLTFVANKVQDVFFWVMSFITSVLDLEEIAGRVVNETLAYLLCLLNGGKSVVPKRTQEEIEYHALNCLSSLLKYIISKRAAHFVEETVDLWFDTLFNILFHKEVLEKSSMRWKPIWEDVRYIFVAVLTEAEEEKISSHGLINWIRNIKPNTTIEDINVATLKKSFPEIFKRIAEKHSSALLNVESYHLSSSGDESDNTASHGNFPRAFRSKRNLSDEVQDLNTPGSSLAPIMLDSDVNDSDSDSGDSVIPKRNEFNKSFQKVFIDPISYDEDLDYTEDFDLHFSTDNSNESINSVTNSASAELNMQSKTSDSKKNRDMIIIDDDSENSSYHEMSDNQKSRKRKHSEVAESDDEQQQKEKPSLIKFYGSAIAQRERNNKLIISDSEETVGTMQEPRTSTLSPPDNSHKSSEIQRGKKACFEISPARPNGGFFDFLDNIKGAHKNQTGKIPKETASSCSDQKDSENAKVQQPGTKICPLKTSLHQEPDAVPDVDKSTDSVRESKESEHKNNDELTVDSNEPSVGVLGKKFQLDKALLYERFVKKKELMLRLKDSKNKAEETQLKANQKPTKSLESSNIQQTATTEQHSLPVIQKHKLYNMNSLFKYILTWQPMWLKNEQEDELQIMLPCEPQMVKSKYDSYDDYMYTMWPLILIEFFAQIIKDFKENESPELQCKLKSREQDSDSQNFSIFNCASLLECSALGKDFRYPLEDDLVILRCVDEYTTEIFGLIEQVEKTPMRDDNDPQGKFSYVLLGLRIKVSNLLPRLDITSVQIQIVTRLVPLLRRWEALIFLPKSLLAGDILNPFRPQVFETQRNSSSLKFDKYNVSQSNAIGTISEAAVQAFPLPKLRLLQGPPGTGKTYTLKGIIKNMLETLSGKEKTRILLCAPSNAAVDEIAFRLLQDPPKITSSKEISKKRQGHTNCGSFNLLRIGSPTQINHRIGKCSLDYLVNNEITKLKLFSNPDAIKEEIKKILQNLKELDRICTKLKMGKDRAKHAEWKKKMSERERVQRRYEDLQKRLKMSGTKRDLNEEEIRLRKHYLVKADIICCTLSGAGNKHMINVFKNEWDGSNGAPFTCVIIDEAGQCCEPEALIPLQYGSSKLVLVGDPAQLPATVFSKRAFRYGYGQSLFERIQNNLLEHFDTPVQMLEEQYRMHPGICAFPSQKFYNGRLITAREVLQRRILGGIRPFSVLNISNGIEARESRGSIHNPEERKYVLHIINEIRQKGIITMDKVGVVTPYRKQIEKLKEELSRGPTPKGVEINTIDGFQGKEKDVIILSCVRASGGQSGIGFLRDPQRLNVALTRAKHSLIVVMHADSLQVDEDWKDLIDFARSRSLLFDIKSPQDIDAAVFSTNNMSNREAVVAEIYSSGDKEDNTCNINPLVYEDLSEDESEKDGGNEVKSLKKNIDKNEHSIDASKKQIIKEPETHPSNQGTQFSKDDSSANVAVSRTDSTVSSSKVTASNPKGHYKLPHHHSDGTKCLDRCKKTGERATPSNAYYKLPHIHSDGLRCIDKCIRVEEREKKRRLLKEEQKHCSITKNDSGGKALRHAEHSKTTQSDANMVAADQQNLEASAKLSSVLEPGLSGQKQEASLVESLKGPNISNIPYNSMVFSTLKSLEPCTDIRSAVEIQQCELEANKTGHIFPPLPPNTEAKVLKTQNIPEQPASPLPPETETSISKAQSVPKPPEDPAKNFHSGPIIPTEIASDLNKGNYTENVPHSAVSEPYLLQAEDMEISNESSDEVIIETKAPSSNKTALDFTNNSNEEKFEPIMSYEALGTQNDVVVISNESSPELLHIEDDASSDGNAPPNFKSNSEKENVTPSDSYAHILISTDDEKIHCEYPSKDFVAENVADKNGDSQNSYYFLGDAYQPKVLLDNCLKHLNSEEQYSTGHIPKNLSCLKNRVSNKASSSIIGSFDLNSNLTDSDVNDFPSKAIERSSETSDLCPENQSLQAKNNSSRPATSVSSICQTAGVGDEIHRIRLSTNQSKDDLSFEKGEELTEKNDRNESPVMVTNANIHPERRSIIEANTSKTTRTVVINEESFDDNRTSNARHRHFAKGNSRPQLRNYWGPSESKEPEMVPSARVRNKRVKRFVRIGSLEDDNRACPWSRPFGESVAERQHESSESRQDTIRGFNPNRFHHSSVDSGRHFNRDDSRMDNRFSSVSHREPQVSLHHPSNFASDNHFLPRKNRRIVSPLPARQSQRSSVSKVEEITQRIRQRNLSRNHRTQLLSENQTAQFRGRSRSRNRR